MFITAHIHLVTPRRVTRICSIRNLRLTINTKFEDDALIHKQIYTKGVGRYGGFTTHGCRNERGMEGRGER